MLKRVLMLQAQLQHMHEHGDTASVFSDFVASSGDSSPAPTEQVHAQHDHPRTSRMLQSSDV